VPRILIDAVDFDALEVILERYKGAMSDLDREVANNIIKKYNAVESNRERLKQAWAKVKMYEPGTEENKQAYLEYKKLSGSIKK